MFDDSFKARYTTLPVAVYTHTRRNVPSSFVPHNHREIELIVMTAGEATVFVGSATFTLAAGDLLVIPPYCVHYARMAPETSYECLCFDPNLLCDVALREGLEGGRLTVRDVARAGTWGGEVADLTLAAARAHKAGETGWELAVCGSLSLLFAH